MCQLCRLGAISTRPTQPTITSKSLYTWGSLSRNIPSTPSPPSPSPPSPHPALTLNPSP
ncbi:MAG: hypothetical protein MJA27_18075 [Pseudanabaenales cyanobacterium]|nr:hypothetical protein [Pseudanabaenales cyanobacterium]